MSITEQIPSPGEYLLNQHERYHYEHEEGSTDKAFMIAAQTNSFIDVLIKSDEYHKQRME